MNDVKISTNDITGDDSIVARRLTVMLGSCSPEFQAIVMEHLPRWIELFGAKNGEYQDSMGTSFTLGERGQFSDIYRKVMKLKRSLWDGESLYTEDEDEILMDLIGHCFLTMEMLERRNRQNAISIRERLGG